MKLVSVTLMLVACFQSASAQTIIKTDERIANAAAAISSDSLKKYVSELVALGTRNTLSTQSDPKRGIGAARDYVLQKFRQFAAGTNGRMSAIIDTVTLAPDGRRVNRPIVLGNVVATLNGTADDNRVFIISGHLDNMRSNVMDSIGDAPGANDDASGVAAVLECARILSKAAPQATIMFVAFSGEEQGLLGARFMAEKTAREGMRIEGILNNDIMGSNNSFETGLINNTQVRVFSEGLSAFETDKTAINIRRLGLENDGRSRQLARYVKEIGERYVSNIEVKMIYRNDRFLRGGDHTPFVEKGFPAVRITEMNEDYRHQHQDVRIENGMQYGDLIQFMDFEYLRKNTAVNLSSLYNLAMAPDVPQKVSMDVKKLSNSTSLSWQAPAAGAAAGYYVLVRETTEACWQKKIFTQLTSLTLPYSKDNYFFAVQSVNASGNESLAVVPVPDSR